MNYVFPRGTLLLGPSFSWSEPIFVSFVSDHEEKNYCAPVGNQMLNVSNSFSEVTMDRARPYIPRWGKLSF